ncbi:MAG: polysaccharide export protein [Myxococcales bacterium]|nr:polysaccharide export protein [Myxococcales bacterium]MCB9525003.1 polysaccharide export protein [Myxococcales bacterium]
MQPIFRIALLFVFVLLAGCGPVPEGSLALPPVPETSELLQSAALGPGDVVEVRVYQEKELSGLYRLSNQGTFNFPLVGEVPAEGRSAPQLAAYLTDRLKEDYLRNPQVSVFVKEHNSKKVFVLGEVKKPGTFPYVDHMSVVQAITLAGGFKPLAAKGRLVLTRVVDGAEQKFIVPFDRISLGLEPNVTLRPGDIVFVPESWL